MFYFIRHGEPDDSARNTKIYQGYGVNLAGLSRRGVLQVEAAAQDVRLRGVEVILCSPYTRAVQTGAILSRTLDAALVVETDLYEWQANKHFVYVDDKEAWRALVEYERCHGEYPAGTDASWESAASMRARVFAVLERYTFCGKVLVACHGLLMQAVTGRKHPKHGEIVEFDWNGR